jgi:hypothetical protein
MKKLGISVLVLALVNLLAIGGFIGWLGLSGRLSVERLRQARALFTPTVAQQASVDGEQGAAQKQAESERAEAARRTGAPMGPDARLAMAQAERDLIEQQTTRLREEARQLQTVLAAQRSELTQVSKMLDTAKADLAAQRSSFEQQATDTQFQQALSSLEGQKAKDAAKLLRSILDEPAPESAVTSIDAAAHARRQRDTVVRYLSAMGDRARNRVLAELIKVDERLAAELLEQVRQRGTERAAAGAATP